MQDIKKYDEWIQSSRILQIRYISILTAILYFIYFQIDLIIVPIEALSFVQSIHIFFLFFLC